MRILKIPEAPKINNDLKRWMILNKKSEEIVCLTDNSFSDGIKKGYIELRSKFVQNKNHRIWIDGLFK